MFELFDPQQEYIVRHGQLPHWYQPGVTYFITMRLEDSVPQALVRSWHGERDVWLREHGIGVGADWKLRLRKAPELEREYHARFTKRYMTYLDRGYGRCVLRDERAATIVAESLHHFDGDRYELGDFVVMPNHVHLLVCLIGETEIEAQCRSWKKYTATQINRLLGTSGRMWQAESFDHLVRSPEQFEYFRWYIANNPHKTQLREGEFLYCPKVVGTLRAP
jgi:REP element-mobilizing transposase RayT